MRKYLWIVLGLVFTALFTPTAHADSYTNATLFFDGPEGSVPTGSFVYDNTTNEFTSFWVGTPQGGFSFDHDTFTSSSGPMYLFDSPNCSNGPSPCPMEEALFHTLISGGTFGWNDWFICCGSYDGGFDLAGVEILNNAVCCGANASGTFTVVTPEPSTFGLVFAAVGLLLVIPKRTIVRNDHRSLPVVVHH